VQLDELWTFAKKKSLLAVPMTLSASTGGRGYGGKRYGSSVDVF
jgi:hypothetical protein